MGQETVQTCLEAKGCDGVKNNEAKGAAVHAEAGEHEVPWTEVRKEERESESVEGVDSWKEKDSWCGY